MFALYYLCPNTGHRLPCISSRHMSFGEPDAAPALFAQAKNIVKVLRDYKKNAIEHYAAQGYRHCLAGNQQGELPTADDPSLKDFRIVPVILTPDFANEETF